MHLFQKTIHQFVDSRKKYRKVIFVILLAAIVLPDVTMYFHKPNRGGDFHGYITAGRDALKLEDLYRFSSPGHNNTWPPFFSFFSIPFALSEDFFGLPITKELWYVLNFAAFVAIMKMILLLIHKKKPSFFPGKNELDFTSDLIFVPFFLILPAFIHNFFMLQINLLILFFIITGYLFFTRGNEWKAGFFFGLAAATKAYPGLFLIYFLLRKQWKTALAILSWASAFTIFPMLFYGFEQYIDLMKEWLSMSLTKPLIVGYHSCTNQSLYAFWERLLAHQLHLTEPASVLIKTANFSSVLIIATVVFSSIMRFSFKKSPVNGIIEISCICSMMILFSPIAWRHYWVLLLPATSIIYYCLRKLPQVVTPLIKTLFVIYVLLLGIPYLFSKTSIAILMRTYSCYTFAALVILLILIILHKKVNLQLENQKPF